MTLKQYARKFPNIDWRHPSPAAEFAMTAADRKRHRDWLMSPPAHYNPGPEYFREGAIAAATGERVGRAVTPEIRYWAEWMLGAKDGLIGFSDYGTVPDHRRVISFLLLEIIAREGL